jgi:hypothetical protein
MCSVVDLGEVLKIKVRVDLRGRNIGMTEQFLDATQILTRFEQMGCEGMAKHMRVHMDAETLSLRPLTDA